MSDEEITPPNKTIGDWLHTLTKAAVSVVPWVGGPAAEIFAAIVMPPRSKRMNDWMESVVRKLENCTMDSLQNNPAFVSAVLHGTQIAIRSHQKEKLDALRNAVLNVASGNAPDDDLQLVFLNMIDLFTPTHLQLLRVFQDRSSVSSGVIDNFRQQRVLTDPVVNDLNQRGLLDDPRPYVARGRDSSDSLIIQPWQLSKLGNQFMKFVSAPAD